MKDLVNSHLMPAAMYKYVRDPSKKNQNPFLVDRRVRSTTSRQVSDYLLCAACEDLFNKNGENWMLKQVWNGKRFPLGDLLKVALQRYTFQSFIAFSGADVGVDTNKLGYFALSTIWRAAVHEWDTPFGGKTTLLRLGTAEEPIRKFLLGEAGFPNDVVVLATVCTDPASIRIFYLPSPVSRVPGTAFGLHALGVHLMVFVGTAIPRIMREMCCVKSGKRLIFQRDCFEKTVEAFGQIIGDEQAGRGYEGYDQDIGAVRAGRRRPAP